MKQFNRLIHIAVIMVILLPLAGGLAAPAQQTTTPQERARALLDSLTPEERVGQLFLVTFNGPEAGARTPIYDLVVNHHIGGVILKASNDNFLAHDQTIAFAHSLARQLQSNEYTNSQQPQSNQPGEASFTPAFIPLFIGLSQEGDGYPYDQILSAGMTQLPSQMAIGATWQPEMARQVGYVLGNELSALGFNLLLGPSLDVLESPYIEGKGDLGVRTFGGDPFWVGEMGRAYISGVHEGSEGEMAVIATHFPGYGSTDRLP
ncbi:MAG: glycoside hydrolase family 3 protein [Chloroflexota bacterium]|nr:MAG: glycoside hydrolase family 3 protein [Chloroflexota bacterium]